MLSLPGVGVVRASNYGAALGDPFRFANEGAAYRAAGLVPARYESAGTSRKGLGITKAGSVELRQAIIELGMGLTHHEPDFAAYRARLRAAGKIHHVAQVAVGHRCPSPRIRHGPQPRPLRPATLERQRERGPVRHGEDQKGPPTSDVTGPRQNDRPDNPPRQPTERGHKRQGPGPTSIALRPTRPGGTGRE